MSKSTRPKFWSADFNPLQEHFFGFSGGLGTRKLKRTEVRPPLGQLSRHFTILWLISLILLALPNLAPASSSSALKRYQTGKYESALREYKRLLLDKPDDPRLHFNAGAAAFQANDFDEAKKQLNSALVTPDLQLQQRSYYNLGNTEYRLGNEAQAPDKKKADWEQAIVNYESALKLNPKDDDAKFNMELVKKKLEELQKQQQQQKQDQKDSKDDDKKDQSKQDKKDKQDQQNKDEKKDKDKQDQQQQDQNKQDKQDQQKKPDQNQDEKKQDEAQQKQDKEKDKEEQAKQGQESKDQKPEDPEDQQGQAQKGVMARMTPKEAQQLLDAQKIDEKAMIFIPKLRTNRNDRILKDW